MKLKLILLTILLMTSVNIIAQERTDKSENIQAVTCRMKYRQYRHYYRAKDYVKDFDDKYSPAGLGVASFFIPGLGQELQTSGVLRQACARYRRGDTLPYDHHP